MMSFDEYVKKNWPEGAPEECSNVAEFGDDCIEQNRPEFLYCKSCEVFARLTREYEALKKKSA